MFLRLILPLPPSINHQYATVKGKRVLSWEARAYKEKTIEGLRKASLKLGLYPRQLEAWRESYLCLSFDFYFRTPRRRDLDGGLKIAQDVICQAFRINDNRVVQACLAKRIDLTHPRMEVTLKALPAWDFCPPSDPAREDPDLTLDLLPPKARHAGKGKARKRPRSLEELAEELGWEEEGDR
ncbi:MAG: RusA family crossover junction endodeoxyribonuclease [Candidatus Tectomicrobia bacterium]|uniref:RusA family crossover junction endodeoxyribonuclease n=1 Tax=Tectimicrobiota bacterium TaxID=2528274 RepID=A0A932CQT0_UNCTE|nr:RusA family crossover junction endodeoxyribonuclease [Candidatus Tectomicrobia bacterium]